MKSLKITFYVCEDCVTNYRKIGIAHASPAGDGISITSLSLNLDALIINANSFFCLICTTVMPGIEPNNSTEVQTYIINL